MLGQNPNQFVILPIVILIQSIEGALSEHFRRNLRYLDDFRKITAGRWKMLMTVPLLSSQRSKMELASAMNRHINSSASVRSALAT